MWTKKDVVLVEVITEPYQKALVEQRFEELEELVTTYGGCTVVHTVQQRAKPDYKTYVWSGKLEEIKDEMLARGARLLVIGNIMKPQQIYNVNEYMRKFWLEARDRVDLILNIFERHATTTEAKLQIELAAIKHMWPRIFGMWMELSRQWATGGGWSGAARWLGETNVEIMKRHLAKRERQIQQELKNYEHVRATHRHARKRSALPVVGLVWYTNAWKSSLMRALTNEDVYIADKLFATLGTHVSDIYFPRRDGKGEKVLLNDTIGFIRDLPPQLIQAFSSTLEDSIESDILLHVIDVSDPLRDDKIQVVDEILDHIGAQQPRYYIFNKTDLVSQLEIAQLQRVYRDLPTCWISTMKGEGIDQVKQLIAHHLIGEQLDDEWYLQHMTLS